MNFRALCKKLYRRLPRPPSTNYYLADLRQDPYALLPAGAIVVDLGAKDAQGGYAFCKKPPKHLTILSLDIEPSAHLDVVGDALRLPFADGAVDAITCVSTLEHVKDPARAVAEMHRVLKPSGIVYVNVPFVFPYHADPDDYFRFSRNGVRTLCAEFDEIQSGFNRGPASTMCHLLTHFMAIALSFNRKWLYGLLVDLFQWCFFWIKYLDRWIGRFEMAKVIHSGSFFLGSKPTAAL